MGYVELSIAGTLKMPAQSVRQPDRCVDKVPGCVVVAEVKFK